MAISDMFWLYWLPIKMILKQVLPFNQIEQILLTKQKIKHILFRFNLSFIFSDCDSKWTFKMHVKGNWIKYYKLFDFFSSLKFGHQKPFWEWFEILIVHFSHFQNFYYRKTFPEIIVTFWLHWPDSIKCFILMLMKICELDEFSEHKRKTNQIKFIS